MFCRRTAQILLAILVIVPVAAAQDGHLWVGPKRKTMHLMGFANDYRAVDIPFLIDPKATGDAWLGVFKSFDGGQTWQSTLLPGYPQDPNHTAPLWGYEAGADPVVRAGTDGLFYLTGIVFDRGEAARSALFLSRYMDLNNLESGDPIEFIDTQIVKENAAEDPFIDKPWMAVDIPRFAAPAVTLAVETNEKSLSQSVECGNVYLAWAEVFGLAPHQRSNIMFMRSSDCGVIWSDPIILNPFDTMAQGVSIAISPSNGDVWVTWRQFNTTPPCTADAGYWKNHPEEWAIRRMTLGKAKYSAAEILDILHTPAGGDASYILAHHLIAAKLNVASGISGDSLEGAIDAADDWLEDFPLGSNPVDPDRQDGIDLKDLVIAHNQGLMEGCFGEGGSENANMAVRSTDAILNNDTITLSPPMEVSTLHPFEQGTTEYSFRTNAYPTITVDDSQPNNRAYIAYAARGFGIPRGDEVEGDARVVVSTSTDSVNWTVPTAIDQPEVPGHQFDPSITFAGGKVVLVYYDLRRDMSGIFDRFIADFPSMYPIFRHTVDVRAAQADPADDPEFTVYGVSPGRWSDQVSRYLFLADYPGNPGDPDTAADPAYLQLKYNLPNLPINLDGLKPFFGDYIDVAASPPFVPDGEGGWRYNTSAEDGATFHVVWTDNRDIEAPHDGDWSNYVPPGYATDSVFYPEWDEDRPPCVAGCEGQTRIRDQNTYTARLTSGLFVGSPGGSRPIDAMQRAFVVLVRNDSEETKTFMLSLESPDPGSSVSVSFEQFVQTPTLTLYVEIEAASSAARTVFVTVENEVDFEPVRVDVIEVEGPGGEVIDGGLASAVVLNPDLQNPPPADQDLLTVELYTPAMLSRTLTEPELMELAMLSPGLANLAMLSLAMLSPAMLSPAMLSPAMLSPAMLSMGVLNPAMLSPAMLSLAMLSPAMLSPAMLSLNLSNPAMLSPAMLSPAMLSPAMLSPAMLSTPPVEITWEIENVGNASTAYSFNLLGDNAPCPTDEEILCQLFIYREYKTPASYECDLVESTEQQMVVNVVDPEFHDIYDEDELEEAFTDPGITDHRAQNPTFSLDKGQKAKATLWIYDTNPNNQKALTYHGEDADNVTFGAEDVWAAVVAQPVNTDDAAGGEEDPSFATDPSKTSWQVFRSRSP
jgi:hypothetical protein